MARGFGSTLGSGSTDRVTPGYTLSGDDKRSYALWYKYNGLGGGNFGSLWRKGALSVQHDQCFVDSTHSNTLVFKRTTVGGTVTGQAWIGGTLATGSWNSFVLTHDGSQNSQVDPVFYLNGVTASVVSAAGSVHAADNTSPYVIGNVSDGTRNWDGSIAWFTIWANTILTALEAAALAQGAPPWKIRPASVVLCVPLFGLQSPEFDQQGITNGGATVTGTKFQMAPLPDFFDLS